MTANPHASEYLLSPDGIHLAIRHPESFSGQQGAPWHCTDGSCLRDDQVAGWQPLRTMSLSEAVEVQDTRRALGELPASNQE